MSETFNPRPVILEGRFARLEPMDEGHAEELFEASRNERLFAYMPCAPLRSVEDAAKYIDQALRSAADGSQIPFTIFHRGSSRVAGSTRYLDIQRQDRALEIGFTFVSSEHQRTPLNTECKYLLLKHAFTDLGAIRVQFKTDARNLQSQKAMERLGLVREGVLRKHRVLWNGFIRDSVFYSAVDDDWPAIRKRLEEFLSRPWPPTVPTSSFAV